MSYQLKPPLEPSEGVQEMLSYLPPHLSERRKKKALRLLRENLKNDPHFNPNRIIIDANMKVRVL